MSFLLVLLAGAGLANGAGAAPLNRDKPARTPGLTPVSDCTPDPRGDLDAHITDHPDHTSAVFTNSSQHCSYQIGLATYMKVDDNIDHQIFYDGQTAVIAPESTLTLQVGNPPCAYQGDAFWGRMLKSLEGGVRYGERRLDDTDGVNSTYCVVAATATPTQQAAPPTATATAAPPTATATSTPQVPTATATATAVPPSATATNTPTNTPTAMPPTATATNTPTPGAQKVRPTNTPTPIPAGSPPAPTATATAVTVVAPPAATSTPAVVPPTATTGAGAPPPATATATAVLAPPTVPAPAGGAPPAATAARTPAGVPGTTGGAPSAPPPAAPPGGQETGPVSQVGPLVGSNAGPAPSELPRTGAPDLGWLPALVVAALALGSGLLLRRRAS
ncbi:MAG TPA: hypothetical protein VF276_07685 [Chloroflexia bacterium]